MSAGDSPKAVEASALRALYLVPNSPHTSSFAVSPDENNATKKRDSHGDRRDVAGMVGNHNAKACGEYAVYGAEELLIYFAP